MWVFTVALGCRFDADLSHDRKVVFALAIGSLARRRAAPQPEAFKFFLAMGAADIEALWPDPHAVVNLWLQPVLPMASVAIVVPFPATVVTESTAPIDHAAPAGEAFDDVALLAVIGAKQVALDHGGDFALPHVWSFPRFWL
jgi:hypothetical protein